MSSLGPSSSLWPAALVFPASTSLFSIPVPQGELEGYRPPPTHTHYQSRIEENIPKYGSLALEAPHSPCHGSPVQSSLSRLRFQAAVGQIGRAQAEPGLQSGSSLGGVHSQQKDSRVSPDPRIAHQLPLPAEESTTFLFFIAL